MAIYATARKLVSPSHSEGFDGIFRVRMRPGGRPDGAGFEVSRVRSG